MLKDFRRGDTIIEVMFAIAVFSAIAIGTLAIMNSGTATAQRSLEITLVRQQIDAQAEALRFIHESYVSSQTSSVGADDWAELWEELAGRTTSAGSGFTMEQMQNECRGDTVSGISNGFILNTRQPGIQSRSSVPMPAVYSRVNYDGNNIASGGRGVEGMWIQAMRIGSNDGLGYAIDFHIRACWDAPGSSNPVTLGTIVRLYDPR